METVFPLSADAQTDSITQKEGPPGSRVTDLYGRRRCSTSMKTIFSILAVLAAAVVPPFASADGLPVVGVVDPAEVGGQIRYEALPDERDTFVQRTESKTGTLLQSRSLPARKQRAPRLRHG